MGDIFTKSSDTCKDFIVESLTFIFPSRPLGPRPQRLLKTDIQFESFVRVEWEVMYGV